MAHRLGVALVVVVALVVTGRVPAAGAGVVTSWVRPVDGAVVRAFDPPQSRFGAGHLGVDLAAPHGAPVRAAGPGVVSFAGRVAGALHVVVTHAGDLRTSYSYLASVGVRRGQRVGAGDILGTAGGAGPGHDGTVLHFGLRSGDAYLDPLALFRPVDLAAVVHLAPTTEPPHPTSSSSERRGLLAGLVHDVGVAVHGAGVAIDAAGRASAVAGRAVGRAVVAGHPVLSAVARGELAWVARSGSCNAHAPPANGEGGSGHRVMVVAGIDSSLSSGQSSMALPVSDLGYRPGEVTYFSYAPDGGDYAPADTEGPIIAAARRLAGQLRELQRKEPGREVDLLAHSQGGVVVEAFLTLIYRPGDRSYPPLGTVVTLASPLRGDALASSVSQVARTGVGGVSLAATGAVAGALGEHLPLLTPALRDLAADSPLMRRLDAAPLPDEIEMTTIGAATDLVVPATGSTRAGARGTTVIPRGLNAHTGILEDPEAMRVVRAALEDEPLPCQSPVTALAGAVISTTISSLEERAGTVGAAVGNIVDGRP